MFRVRTDDPRLYLNLIKIQLFIILSFYYRMKLIKIQLFIILSFYYYRMKLIKIQLFIILSFYYHMKPIGGHVQGIARN